MAGIENYGDSMATHYLGTDEDEAPHDVIGSLPRKRITKGKGQWVYGTPESPRGKEMGLRDKGVDRRYMADAQPTAVWARNIRKMPSVASGPKQAGPARTPNLEKPLSKKKQEAMPLDMSPKEHIALVKHLTETQGALQQSSRSIEYKGGNLRLGETTKDLGPYQRRMSIDKKKKKLIFTPDKVAAQEEVNQIKNDAWRWLRSGPGTPEKTSGRVITSESGRTLVLSKENLEKGTLGAVWRDKPEPLKSTVPAPETGPTRRMEKAKVSVMPGYDPHAEKYPNNPHLGTMISNVLKRRPMEEAIRTGMAIEKEHAAAHGGPNEAMQASWAAGEHHLATIDRSRAAAEASTSRSVSLMNEFTQRALAHQEARKSTASLRKARLEQESTEE